MPVSVDDLRLFLSVRLTVAPRHWFHDLWKPRTPATDRDKVRDQLVDFITQGWVAYRITAVEYSVFDASKDKSL